LQHALYRAAKADPGRRFHALYDKVCRRDVVQRGWVAVRANNGAPGIDRTTLAQVEEYGVARPLDEVAGELREGRYRPLPARRVWIPKPGTSVSRVPENGMHGSTGGDWKRSYEPGHGHWGGTTDRETGGK
jgi:RNA-directed DNA polymerase